MEKKKRYLIYKIFYKDDNDGYYLAYIGRTSQRLNERLRKHYKQGESRFCKLLSAQNTHHILYAECNSEADMFMYEIYYINKCKPPINRDDKSKDELTVWLPELTFFRHDMSLVRKYELEEEERQIHIECGCDWNI